MLPGIDARAQSRLPERDIKLEAGDAGGGRIHSGLQCASIEEHAGPRNPERIFYQRGMFTIEKIRKQAKRFRGDKLAAYFVAGKASALEQQHAGALSRRRDRSGGPCRARSDDDQIVIHSVVDAVFSSQCFHATTPMRNR